MAHILILDDDRVLCRQWQAALQECNHSVDVAMNVVEAEAIAGQINFDLVIVDMFIRDQNGDLSNEGGLTFLAKLFRKQQMENAPIPKRLAVTGATQSQFFNYDPLEGAKTMQVDATLRKPFNNEDLVAAVDELIASNTSLN